MKETGIIMSGNHPKLVLDGRKTQTRRVIKITPDDWELKRINHGAVVLFWPTDIETDGVYKLIKCPYGQVGDRLWVRETHKLIATEDGWVALYKADDTTRLCNCVVDSHYDGYYNVRLNRWRPSIFMPRWASRITLEITDIRVERLLDMSLADVKAEGFVDDHVDEFENLWDSLNAKRGYGWSSNPWVWVISFGVLNGKT